MSQIISKTKQQRSLAFLVAWSLGIGLVLSIMAYAGYTSPVSAKGAKRSFIQDVDLEIGKQGPDSTMVSQVVTYTIEITNHSGAPIHNVIVTDSWVASIGAGRAGMPAAFNGHYWTDPPNLVGYFTYTLPAEDNLEGMAHWYMAGPLPSGFTGSIHFTMSVPADLQPMQARQPHRTVGPSSLGNSVEITGDNVSANEPDQVVTLIYGPVLTLTKHYTSDVGVRPGRLLTFTLRLRNLSTDERSDSIPATNIVVGEDLPNELIFQDAWGQPPMAAASPEYDPTSRHITWTLAPTFTLHPGESTWFTFSARLRPTQEWRHTVRNQDEACYVYAQELILPVNCWDHVRMPTLGIFDKTYVTEPETQAFGSNYIPLEPDETYPNHLMTYTVHIFNPLSDTAASNLRITDTMPPTWDFVEMVDGPEPVWPTGTITNTLVWHWPAAGGPAIEPDGVMSFTFVALVGPDTPVVYNNRCFRYYDNDLAASADGFPMVYQYGEPGDYDDGLALVKVREQVILDKEVTPGVVESGSIVTYTAILHNQGNRAVHDIIFTDTLAMADALYAFQFVGMVDGPEPIAIITNTPPYTRPVRVIWAIDEIAPQSEYQLVFRAVAEGYWGYGYENGLNCYSPNMSFCPKSEATVSILSPIICEKTANPPLESGLWVVQGEYLTYTVEYWNRSALSDYEIDGFFDDLPIVKRIGGYPVDLEGFEVDGNSDYSHSISPTVLLMRDQTNSWQHAFTADTPGYGSGTMWCDAIRIDAEDSNPYCEQEIVQFAGTFGLHVTQVDDWVENASDESPIWLKPHVDLFHEVYPYKSGYGDTVTVTLRLQNNMRDHNGGAPRSVDNITMTYDLPEGFGFMGMLTPTEPAPITSTQQLTWTGLNLAEGAGQQIILRFLLESPFTGRTSQSFPASAQAMPEDENICIPIGDNKYYVVKGVEVAKEPDAPEVGPFGVVEYHMALTNKTSAPVDALVITDTLPLGFEFLRVVNGPEPTTINPLVWEGLHLEPDGENGDEIQIDFKARASGLFGVNYCNEATGFSPSTYVTYTSGYWNDVCVFVAPGVGMYKSVQPKQAMAEQTVVYTVTIANRSGQAIEGLVITDTLPTGFSYQEMLTGSLPVSITPFLVWELPNTLGAGQEVNLVFAAYISEEITPGIYYNQASAIAHRVGDPGNLVVIPDTDLAAPVSVLGTIQRSKTVQPTTAPMGQVVTYTISLRNLTDAPQTLRVTDTLPAVLTFEGVLGSTPLPVMTSPVVWQGLNVGLSETLTLTFQARIAPDAQPNTYYNRLDVSTAEFSLPTKPNLAPLLVTGIEIFPITVHVAESGVMDSYTVSLTKQPSADVIIYIHPDEQSSVTPALLLFDSSTWNTPRQVLVSAVDDARDEALTHVGIITHQAVSDDSFYNDLPLPDVTAMITDDDTAGVTVTPPQLSVQEQGATSATYQIVLDSQPSDDVLVTLVSDEQINLSPGDPLVFTPADWNQARTLTVSAVDDAVAEDPTHTSAIYHNATSEDAAYNGISIADLTVFIDDNDAAGVSIEPINLSVLEGGDAETYRVHLRSQPADGVTVSIAADSQVTITPVSLTFDQDNWTVAQQVMVGAVDDVLPEGLHSSTLEHSAASADSFYHQLPISDVLVTITDNDTAGVFVYPNTVYVDEVGPTSDSYNLVLTKAPTESVAISVHYDQEQVLAEPALLDFDADNWNTPQSVLVTAVRDPWVEGTPHTSLISHTSSSPGSSYDGIEIANVTVLISDSQAVTLECDLEIRKDDGVQMARAGDVLRYSITYTHANSSELTLNSVIITETFDPPPPYATPIDLGGWQQVSSDTYRYVLEDVDAGQSGFISFSLQLAVSIPNTISLISNLVAIGHDPNQFVVDIDLSNNQYTDLNTLQHGEMEFGIYLPIVVKRR